MNTSPLPQPSAQTCPNCGAAVAEGVVLCPNCGASLATRKGDSGWSVLGQVLLAFVALGSGLFGACFVLIGGGTLSGGISTESLLTLAIGGVGVLIAALCIRQIIKMGQRNRR